MPGDDDTADDVTPPAGTLASRIATVETRLTLLDAREEEHHGAVVASIHREAGGLRAQLEEAVSERRRVLEHLEAEDKAQAEVLAKIEALSAGLTQTTTLRVLDLMRFLIERMFTPTAAPFYAVAVLVLAVTLTATQVRWGDLIVGRTAADASNADSDAASGASSGLAEPAPAP